MATWTLSQWAARIRHAIKAGNTIRLTASLVDAQQFLSAAPHVPQDDTAWITLLRAVEDGLTATGQRHEYPTHRQAGLTMPLDDDLRHHHGPPPNIPVSLDVAPEIASNAHDSDETKLPWE